MSQDTPAIAALRSVINVGKPEAEIRAWVNEKVDALPEDEWLAGSGALITDAIYYGYLGLYTDLDDRLDPDPAFHASKFSTVGCMSKNPAVLREVLVRSEGIELSTPEAGLQVLFCSRYPQALVSEMLEVFFADVRLRTPENLMEAWHLLGNQGQADLVPTMRAIHQAMEKEGVPLHPHMIARGWEEALANLIRGIDEDQDMVGVVRQTAALLTPEQIVGFLNWENSRVRQKEIYFGIYDQLLTPDNERLAKVTPALPVEQWRALLFQASGARLMPREGAKHREARASLPEMKEPGQKARARVRP